MLRKSLAAYYATLGLQSGDSPEKIKQAYRTLVRQWHPDKFTHDRRLQQTAEAKLKNINEAYAVLRGLGQYASSHTQPSNTGAQTARTYSAGSSGAGRTYSAGSSSAGRTYTSASSSTAGRTYTAAGANRPGQSTTAQSGPSTTWHSAPVSRNRKSYFFRLAPVGLLYGLLILSNVFNSTSTHSAPAELPSTPPSTSQFTDIMPIITNAQRALDEFNRQNPAAGRKEPRIKLPVVPLRYRDTVKLQREIFGAAAKPMTYKRVINSVNVDWPGFKIADLAAEKQDINSKPLPVPIVPSGPK